MKPWVVRQSFGNVVFITTYAQLKELWAWREYNNRYKK